MTGKKQQTNRNVYTQVIESQRTYHRAPAEYEKMSLLIIIIIMVRFIVWCLHNPFFVSSHCQETLGDSSQSVKQLLDVSCLLETSCQDSHWCLIKSIFKIVDHLFSLLWLKIWASQSRIHKEDGRPSTAAYHCLLKSLRQSRKQNNTSKHPIAKASHVLRKAFKLSGHNVEDNP